LGELENTTNKWWVDKGIKEEIRKESIVMIKLLPLTPITFFSLAIAIAYSGIGKRKVNKAAKIDEAHNKQHTISINFIE
jgi:hypothetical protein